MYSNIFDIFLRINQYTRILNFLKFKGVRMQEAILTHLGYQPNAQLISQADEIVNNTPGFEKFKKHLMTLHEHLKIDDAFVALSNSENFFKIKCIAQDEVVKKRALTRIDTFAKKYKVEIKEVVPEQTFYVLGIAS